MKTKSLFLLTITMLALAACSENEITEQNPEVNKPIGFDTYASVQTRGKEMIMEAIKQLWYFGVMAYQTTGDYSTTGAKSEFMNNQQVNFDNSKNVWYYNPVKFWPVGANEKISFFAYAPHTSNTSTITLTSATDNSDPKINFTQETTYQHNMIDLVVSDPATSGNNATMNRTSASGTVTFKFLHPLTRVDMVAKTGTDISQNADTKVFITGVSLIHSNILNSKGTLDMKTLTWADNTTDYFTSPYVLTAYDDRDYKCGVLILKAANFAGYTTPSIDISAGGTTATPLFYTEKDSPTMNEYLFFLPVSNDTGTAADGDVKVKIAYDIVNKITDATHSKSSVEKTVNLPAGILKKGTAYKFTFTIGLNAISFDVATDMGWGTVTDNDITIQ